MNVTRRSLTCSRQSTEHTIKQKKSDHRNSVKSRWRVAMFCCNVAAEFEWLQVNASKHPTRRKPRWILVLLTPVVVSESELKPSAGIRNPMLYPAELQAPHCVHDVKTCCHSPTALPATKPTRRQRVLTRVGRQSAPLRRVRTPLCHLRTKRQVDTKTTIDCAHHCRKTPADLRESTSPFSCRRHHYHQPVSCTGRKKLLSDDKICKDYWITRPVIEAPPCEEGFPRRTATGIDWAQDFDTAPMILLDQPIQGGV